VRPGLECEAARNCRGVRPLPGRALIAYALAHASVISRHDGDLPDQPERRVVRHRVITPRWLYVLASATPAEYGDPTLIDETLEPFAASGGARRRHGRRRPCVGGCAP
jgi:hypothetical protein